MIEAARLNPWTKKWSRVIFPDWHKLDQMRVQLMLTEEERKNNPRIPDFTVEKANQLQVQKQGNRCTVMVMDSNPTKTTPFFLYKGISMPISGIGLLVDYNYQYGDYASARLPPHWIENIDWM